MFTILIFGSLVIIIEMGDDLGCNNIQKHGKQTVLQNQLDDDDKGVRQETFFFFRLNIVLHDSYQADEIVMEIEEWQQKVPDDYVKSFSRVLLIVFETSIVSLKNCIMNLKFDYIQLIIEFRVFGVRFLNIFKYSLLF